MIGNYYIDDDDYDSIQEGIEKYLARDEDFKVDEFCYHKDDKNTLAFILKRGNELRAQYKELKENEEVNKSQMEDIVTRAEMFLTGLLLFEFPEG